MSEIAAAKEGTGTTKTSLAVEVDGTKEARKLATRERRTNAANARNVQGVGTRSTPIIMVAQNLLRVLRAQQACGTTSCNVASRAIESVIRAITVSKDREIRLEGSKQMTRPQNAQRGRIAQNLALQVKRIASHVISVQPAKQPG